MKSIWKFLMVAFLCVSCLEEMPYDLNEVPTNRLVVDGGLTTENKVHQIILSLTGKVEGDNPFRPASGANIQVFDGEWTFDFVESENKKGYYQSDSISVDIEKTYSLTIEYNGQVYEASANGVPSHSFEPIEYFPFEGGPTIGEFPQGFYEIALPGNFGAGEAYLYFLEYYTPEGWKDDFPYPIPPLYDDNDSFGPSDTTYLIHPGLEPAALFEYGETYIGGLPLGTQLTEKRYYLTEDYYFYLRAILMETDWRGANIMQTVPANVPSNISNGALGYFYVLDYYEVVSYMSE